jgi:CDP-glucose 4,6-dehydratase
MGALGMSEFWKDKNVLITGATGLVGSWLTKSMVDEGANVVALVRDIVPRSILWSSSDDFEYIKDSVSIVHGSLEDYQLLERTINEYEIEVVFHLGAQTIVGIANRNPLSTFESNIRGSYNLLEACRRNSSLVKAIVVASSDKAYGEHEVLPYNEGMPLQGNHPYDVSKSCTDLLSHTYHNTYDLPVCITRCGNFYGPGDLNFNRIIPETVRHLLRGRSPVIRSDGSFIRDYFYVKDGALAYKFLAEKMFGQDLGGESFNFSNEIQITVLELVHEITRVMGLEMEPTILNKGRNEIKHQYLSAEKARRMLGWKPSYTLEDGLRETIEWYKVFLSRQGVRGGSGT